MDQEAAKFVPAAKSRTARKRQVVSTVKPPPVKKLTFLDSYQIPVVSDSGVQSGNACGSWKQGLFGGSQHIFVVPQGTQGWEAAGMRVCGQSTSAYGDLDPWVLSVVRNGYRIPFFSPPPLTSSPRLPAVPPVDKRVLVEKMVVEFLDKKAIQEVDLGTPGFYSHLFFAQKKNGEWRPILNLKPLNYFVVIPSMKMETVQSVRALLQVGEWAASIDLKDAYLHVPIHRDFWKCLRFLYDSRAYEFQVLPLGLATSPHVFTLVVKAVVGHVHLLGIRMHNYLDDWLIPAASQTACLVGVEFVIDMILRLGFIPNWVKSELVPVQVFTYLEVVFNLVEASVLPTDSQLHNFMTLAQCLLVELHVLIGYLESLAALNVRFRRFKRLLQWHLS
ncbi:uncharacterized protein LOC121369684 [Gigantopelta aegis]|uniref:uncharacterized protein LOC121369684 n=1 Tax=Gigantopelta aegis TaxID=1735272 RepID=UPI001B887475|nr:uncharacterized protein LOC121369684 [Gigantopelta aegis]